MTADDPPLAACEVTGLKYFQCLVPLLGRLHDVGCARDTAVSVRPTAFELLIDGVAARLAGRTSRSTEQQL